MSEKPKAFISDEIDAMRVLYTYSNTASCLGGRAIMAGYCCPHCNSVNPGEECGAPKLDMIQYLHSQGDGIYGRKPAGPPRCNICDKEMNDDRAPDVNCGGDCAQCMAESGDPDCISSIIRWTRSIT